MAYTSFIRLAAVPCLALTLPPVSHLDGEVFASKPWLCGLVPVCACLILSCLCQIREILVAWNHKNKLTVFIFFILKIYSRYQYLAKCLQPWKVLYPSFHYTTSYLHTASTFCDTDVCIIYPVCLLYHDMWYLLLCSLGFRFFVPSPTLSFTSALKALSLNVGVRNLRDGAWKQMNLYWY